MNKIVSKVNKNIVILFTYAIPAICLAEEDPMTTAGNKFSSILFGTFGTTLCAILIGATFLMAKAGKVSWDRFLFIGFCSAGFLGAPSIVSIIKNIGG